MHMDMRHLKPAKLSASGIRKKLLETPKMVFSMPQIQFCNVNAEIWDDLQYILQFYTLYCYYFAFFSLKCIKSSDIIHMGETFHYKI